MFLVAIDVNLKPASEDGSWHMSLAPVRRAPPAIYGVRCLRLSVPREAHHWLFRRWAKRSPGARSALDQARRTTQLPIDQLIEPANCEHC